MLQMMLQSQMSTQFYKYAVGLTQKLQCEADCFVKIHKSIRKYRKIYLSNIYLYIMSEEKVKHKIANIKIKKMIISLHSSEFVLLSDSKGVLLDDLALREKMRKELLNYNPHMEVAYVKQTMLDDYVQGNKIDEKEETLVLNLVRLRNQFEQFGNNIKEKHFNEQYSSIDLIIKDEDFRLITAQKKNEVKQQKKGFSLFKREKKEMYTVKIYYKKLIGQNKMLLGKILRERKYLQQILSPYTPVLYKCMYSKSAIYCITQFYRGEPLKNYLQNQTLTKNQFKSLLSQIVMALGQIHQCNLVYNNVNTKNIFVLDEGFVMLNDFSKCLQVNTAVNEQMLIQLKECQPTSLKERQRVSGSWDWWNLGRLIYEMKQGKKWQANTPIEWQKQPELCQLTIGLLEGQSQKRLGYRNEYHEILAHPYFKNINKKELATKTCEPLKKFFTANPQKIEYVSDGEDWSINDSFLEDYEFSRDLE